MEGYQRFLNKAVAVFYLDSPEHISRKDGVIISVSEDAVILSLTTSEILLPKHKIVRIEVK